MKLEKKLEEILREKLIGIKIFHDGDKVLDLNSGEEEIKNVIVTIDWDFSLDEEGVIEILRIYVITNSNYELELSSDLIAF